jgi:AraC-like DNA-binding protein
LQLIQPVLSALASRGLDPEGVLETVGLTLLAVEQPGATVHVMVIHEFLESCAKATGDNCFCAKVGASLDTTGWPMIRQAMSEARTLGTFLRIYVTKAGQVASSVTAFLDIRGDVATFGEERRFKPLIVPAQNDGFMVGLKVTLLEHALDSMFDRSQVTLVVSDPSVLPKEMKAFRVLKGDVMGTKVQFPSEWLAVPLNPITAPSVPQDKPINMKDADLLSSFRALLRQHVAQGGITARHAADLVRMSPKSLARRLSAFDTTASKEILSAKMDYAKHALTTSDRSVEKISLDLGYSDASNFARAFAKLVGATPTDFRESNRDGSAK